MAPKHFAPVWKYYERHEPTGRSKHHRAVCKFCAYELSGQPERMKSHLHRCEECPQHIRDEHAPDTTTSNGTPYTSNRFAVPTSATELEHAEDDLPTAARLPAEQQQQPPLKRPRSAEVGGGAEGLAGLPWAPSANASTIAPATAAVPPGFQPVYVAPGVAAPGPLPAPVPPPVTPSTQMPPAASVAASHGEPSPFTGVYENVRGYYSRLTPMNKMLTSIGATISPHPLVRDAIGKVPKAVRDRFYGCGVPLPTGIDGLRVLDLGCGSGRDCYVAAKLVGRQGEVIGLDMTDEQLRVAREHIHEYARTLGYQPHLRFIKGYIEFLSQQPELYPGSIDLCISNNAVNLSPNKELVLRSVFEILKEGGEFQFSDIYADRRLPNHVRSHPVLMGECLGGALYTEDFKRLCQRVGFMDARQVNPPAPVRIESPELRDLVGATQFYSITFRLFKFGRPSSVLEPTREDYGQVAIYRGTIDGQRARMRFDNQWAFEANRPVLVDGNTAIMLGESWMQRHFEVRGDRSQHFGGFAADPPAVQYEPWELDHEYEEYDVPGNGDAGHSIGPVIRRRGILPLPTPFFLNGLRQQQQQQQQSQGPLHSTGDGRPVAASGCESPSIYDPQAPRHSPPANGSAHRQPQHHHNSAIRSHTTAFPRLSSFSISQSNVRAECSRPLQRGAAQQQLPGPDRRFVLPASRMAPQSTPMAASGSAAGALPVSGLVPRFLPATAGGRSANGSASGVASAQAGPPSPSPNMGSRSTGSPHPDSHRQQQMSSSPPRHHPHSFQHRHTPPITPTMPLT